MSVGARALVIGLRLVFIVRALDVRCFSEETGGPVFYKALSGLEFHR